MKGGGYGDLALSSLPNKTPERFSFVVSEPNCFLNSDREYDVSLIPFGDKEASKGSFFSLDSLLRFITVDSLPDLQNAGLVPSRTTWRESDSYKYPSLHHGKLDLQGICWDAP
jgi:hypothetical protein